MSYNIWLITINMLRSYTSNLTIARLLICIAVSLVLYLVVLKKINASQSVKKAIIVILYLSSIFVISIAGRTLGVHQSTLSTIFNTYKVWLSGQVTWEWYEILLNILLYIPMGYFLVRFGLSKKSAAVGVFLFSFSIEVTQLILACGLFEICDLIDNTVGGIIGIIMCSKIRKNKIKKELRK